MHGVDMRQWRLIYDTPASGAYNMAADEVAEAVIEPGSQEVNVTVSVTYALN